MDIVDKLRDPKFPPKPAGDTALRLSAADEIERLREGFLWLYWNHHLMKPWELESKLEEYIPQDQANGKA